MKYVHFYKFIILLIIQPIFSDSHLEITSRGIKKCKYIDEEQHVINTKDGLNIYLTVKDTRYDIPSDYAFYPGFGYYKYHKTAAIWADARDTCVKEGGHLVIPDSKGEVDLIIGISNLYPKTKWVDPNVVLIGAIDILSKGEFLTVKGETFDHSEYLPWAPGQPNGQSEHCGCITKDGLLHDCACSTSHNYICEMEIEINEVSKNEL